MYSVLVFLLRYGLAHYRRKSLHRPPGQAALDAAVLRFPAGIFRHPPARNSPAVAENPKIEALGRVVILHATI